MPGNLTWAVIASAEDYAAIRAIAKDDPEFPATYDGWVERRAKKRAECIARGDILHEVVVHPEHFANWCRDSGFDPSYEKFEWSAVALVGRQA